MKEIKLEVQKSSQPASKTTLLNLMILRAWRERWNASQWSINIKNVLPRGVSGDVYNLADCILQQALVGTTANPLVLNYLKHSVCAHLVSHAAVMRRISKFEHLERVYCLIALMEFLNNVVDSITCRNKSEEHLLPCAMVSLVNWLFQIILGILKRYEKQNEMNADDSYLLDCAVLAIEKIVKNQFLLGILVVGRKEEPESYIKIRDTYSLIKTSLVNTSFTFQDPAIENQLNQLAYIDFTHLHMPSLSGSTQTAENITYCLQPLLTVNILSNPCNETSFYVAELLMLQRLKYLPMTRLFYEIIRAGLMSLSNVDETSQDTLWGAFTFCKIPHIIKQLHCLNQVSGAESTPKDYIPEVVDALELLLQDNLLLDSMDSKCSRNIIKSLLDDWAKQHLVTEMHVKHFSGKRENSLLLLQKRETGNQAPSMINFIIRAEVPLSGILKTLCTDYNKVHEQVLGVLTQVLVGNSFDLILSVATVEGRLKTFVSRLIQCNEHSKQIPVEVGKTSIIRSTLFDVSFLMLTFIVQTYGAEAALPENGDSFFEKWVRECMVEQNKPKIARKIVAACDENTVDELLLSLSKPEAQLKNSNITWQDMCMSLPGVLYHVLLAWEKEALSAADVKSILDNIKRLPCFSVCATAYLCAHMHAVRESEFLKPLNMIKQFLTPPTSEEMSSQENDKECLALAFKIIRKMQNDSHAPSHPKGRAVKNLPNVIAHAPLVETFKDVWKTIMDYGWLPARVAQILESVLNVGGPEWLTTQLVNEILKCKYTKYMLKTMDIVFAVLHMDIENTTSALLKHVLPHILYCQTGDEINEPQSYVLARLCVFCIISCLDAFTASIASTKEFKKRTRSQDAEDSELNGNQAKTRKLNSINSETTTTTNITSVTTPTTSTSNMSPASIATVTPSTSIATVTTCSTLTSNTVNIFPNSNSSSNNNGNNNGSNNGNSNSSSNGSNAVKLELNGQANTSQNNLNTRTMPEFLELTLQELFKYFLHFVNNESLSPKAYFVYQFLSLLVEYGKESVRPVLKLLPPNLLQYILKVIATDEVSVGLITRIHDLDTNTGRQAAISDLCLWRNIQLKKEYIQL